jgi:hypothetical protein
MMTRSGTCAFLIHQEEIPMTDPTPKVPVPAQVMTATKAVGATLVLTAGWVALVVKSMADGSITWNEAGELIGAAVVAAGTVRTVWATENRPR